MITFAVCDDEKVHIDIISEALDKIMENLGFQYTVLQYRTAAELLSSEDNYDILFLDIKLDKGNDGIEIGREIIQNRRYHPIIILVTSQDMRVFDGYHIKAHRYIVKPISQKEFNEAVLSALDELGSGKIRLRIEYKQQSHYIPIQTIEYVERYMGQRYVYANGVRYPTNEKWENLVSKLPSSQFFEVHRSFCVNLKMLFSINGYEITMSSGKKIPIARSKRRSFDAAFNSYTTK